MGILLAAINKFINREVLTTIANRCTRLWYPLVVLLVSGCSSDPQIAPDSRLVIQPQNVRFDIAQVLDSNNNCVFTRDFFQDVPINLSVVNRSSQVIPESRITVLMDFAGNTFSGEDVLQLFEDRNGNGVIDPSDELITGIGDDAVTVRTDSADGNAFVLLRVNLSCEFSGSLYAFSGPIAATSQIEVVDGVN